ncbi:MAG: pyridoxamine 5'-phosphate oxidase family protein [Actinomycetota bacterium]|nr:pyridoxamine 5'-phosphate oxidase family protein [Actinomycetota bacterium]
MSDDRTLTLADLQACFEGAIPAVIATVSADGVPNVTYLSRVSLVDDERVALSNQFFSKTAKNLVENPRASVLVLDPLTYEQYRLTLAYERTDRRGPVFERLRQDIDITSALQGMQSVFRLRAADVYRVVDILPVVADCHRRGVPAPDPGRRNGLDASRIAALSNRLGRCGDLDAVVECALDGLTQQFGYDHVILFLHDDAERRLYAIASRGYETQGVGAEVQVGDGLPGLVAQQCAPIRLNNARQVSKYGRALRRSYDRVGAHQGRDIPLPGLSQVQSQLAVPMMALGSLEGVLLVEDPAMVAFESADEAVLGVVASVIGLAIRTERTREQEAEPHRAHRRSTDHTHKLSGPARVRFYGRDGSVFIDGEYLIRGTAGRILASLLRQHRAEGRVEFTSKEVRLDPSLDLPTFRDNFDSRLILLKRRLDERQASVRIDKTGRGRFRLVLERAPDLEEMPG